MRQPRYSECYGETDLWEAQGEAMWAARAGCTPDNPTVLTKSRGCRAGRAQVLDGILTCSPE
jgi:hypothetical protein